MYAFAMMIRPMLFAKICKFVRSSNVRDLIVGLSGQLRGQGRRSVAIP